MWRCWFVVLAVLCSPLQAQTVLGDVIVEQANGALKFSNDAIALNFDSATGALEKVTDKPSGRSVLAAEAADGDQWLPGVKTVWTFSGSRTRVEGGHAVLEVDQEAPGWKATVSYRLWPQKAVFRRDLALIPTAEAVGPVRDVLFTLPGIAVSDAADGRYSMLANWPPEARKLNALEPGRAVAEDFGSMAGHFVVTHSESANLGLVAAMLCETEGADTRVVEGSGKVRVEHTISTGFVPRVGKAERFGSQLVCVARGGWRDALRQGRDLYDLVALAPLAETLQDAQQAVIYSAHAGGTIDSGFQDIGGFTEFAKGLPELKRMGINVVWLLPCWKGQVYAPTDYFALDPKLGTEEELKALVDQAHSLGIKVLGDLIPHGPLEESGLAKEHRDWICTNSDGTMQYWWGCLSCDYSHPGWQGFMAEHAAHWVKRVGLDGYRVDCAGGGPWNWQPYGENRPSMALGGGLAVMGAAREKMRQEKDKVLILAEAGGPAMMRSADIAYNWPLCWNILKGFPGWREEEFVPRLATWLEQQQYWLPKNTNYINFLENHDSVRARMVHGPGPERALMGLCATIPGTPFVYHLQEVGMAPFLANLYQVRRMLPELQRGEADFLSIKCDRPEVMTFLRDDGAGRSIVAINFSEQPQQATLEIPEPLEALSAQLGDAMHQTATVRSDDRKLVLSLQPFATAVLADAARIAQAPPRLPLKKLAIAQGVTSAETAEGITVTFGDISVTVGRDNGGLIRSVRNGGEGELFRGLSLEEGQRRLWVGGERLRIGAQPARTLVCETSSEAGSATVTATGSLERQAEGAPKPVADYQTQYVIRFGGELRIEVSYQIIAREPVENVLGSLTELVQFDPQATEWCAGTWEGFVHDWAVARHPRDMRYGGRYIRGIGDRVWQSQDYALAPAAPFFGAKGRGGTWALIELTGQGGSWNPQNAMLKMRQGEAVGPYARLDWLDGRSAVDLQAGESPSLGYALRFTPLPTAFLQAECETGQAADSAMHTRGSRYELSSGELEFAACRFGGGRVADLRLRGDSEPLIWDSFIYTDGGIYGDRVLPDGVKTRDFVSTRDDSEAEVRFEQEGENQRVVFEGYLRNADGLGLPSPRTRYAVGYGVDGGGSLTVQLGVKTTASIAQAKAFLSQNLFLSRLRSFKVNARDGIAEGTPEPAAQRVWESKTAGFAAEPWMLCSTGTGRALRVAGADLGTAFQNAFLYREGSERGVVFLALNDFEPADIEAVWRIAKYTLTPLKEDN